MQCEGSLAKRLPLGGKKTASSLSRKRLMRGDQSAPTQRLQSLTHPTHKKRATAAHCKKTPPPQTQKTSPITPPFPENEPNLRFRNGGVIGEVLGERERFGGRAPSFKRGLSPSKVFLLPPPLRICKSLRSLRRCKCLRECASRRMPAREA